MTPLFVIAVAFDAVLLLILLGLTLSGSGLSDGGREMALFFYIMVPAIIVAAGALLFLTSRSSARRTVGLVIVVGPGLLLAATRLRSATIDYQVRKNAEGSGYFSGRELKRAGAAVVRRDLAALRALEKPFDANAKGTRGMTLMELAVTQAWESPKDTNGMTPSLDVVRELLALRADPNAGLAIAIKLPDLAILTALLDAGAQPGFASDRGPVVFEWLQVMPFGNFVALLDHRLDPNITDSSGVPLIIAAAQADRWDCVLLLMARGADASRADRQGMRLADVVQSRVESTTARPPEMKADIARVKARLAR
jgi:ankyrin repeat protein